MSDDPGPDVRDPILQFCKNCGEPNSNHGQPEGRTHRCWNCGSFIRGATPHEAWLLGKRMEEAIRLEQGFVAVGGWIEGVDQTPGERVHP